jgi:hypothetical protein
VVFGEQHLRQLLGSYQRYYNYARTHLSLNKDAPASRAVQAAGRITAVPHLGGLHHQYVRICFPIGTGNNREHPVLILTPCSEIDRNGRVAAADRSFNNWGAAKEKLDALSGVKD